MAFPVWLRDYLYGAVIGVLFLFLVGVGMNFSSSSGITGYATGGKGVVEMTGNTKDFKVISFACELTPKEIHVQQGDFVMLRFTSYDLTQAKYLLELPSYDIYLVAKGSEVTSAKFFADQKGVFDYYVKVPCDSYGFKAQGKLFVN